MFFLFLTSDGIQRQDIWASFFERAASQTRYRTFVHCTDWKTCDAEIQVDNPLNATLVGTVPTVYCKDLVTAMAQLLKAATLESTSPHDKFVFLSDSTLPVKPFELVYSALTAQDTSDFCIEGTSHWPKVVFTNMVSAQLVKHSQWVVLSRHHAQIMVREWPLKITKAAVEYWSVPIGTSASHSDNSGGFPPLLSLAQLSVCADEWAIFATIFGAVGSDTLRIDARHHKHRNKGNTLNMPGLSGGPLTVTGDSEKSQGRCHTFVSWGDVEGASESSSTHLMRKLLHDGPATQLSCDPDCKGSHPETIAALSNRSLHILRKSHFLFARKFHDGVPTLDQFKRLVLTKL